MLIVTIRVCLVGKKANWITNYSTKIRKMTREGETRHKLYFDINNVIFISKVKLEFNLLFYMHKWH